MRRHPGATITAAASRAWNFDLAAIRNSDAAAVEFEVWNSGERGPGSAMYPSSAHLNIISKHGYATWQV